MREGRQHSKQGPRDDVKIVLLSSRQVLAWFYPTVPLNFERRARKDNQFTVIA
jgi:hypothetical protein